MQRTVTLTNIYTIDGDGFRRCVRTEGNFDSKEKALKEIRKRKYGLYGEYLIEKITIEEQIYKLDDDIFFKYAEPVGNCVESQVYYRDFFNTDDCK